MASLHNHKSVSRIATTAVFLGLFSALTPAMAKGPGTPPPPHAQQTKITVDAAGSVSVKPDMALLQISVANESENAKDAAEATTEDLKKVLASLKKYDLEDKDMQSNGLMVNTVYHREDPKSKPEKKFRAAASLDLKIRDTQKIGGIIDDAIANGATGVSDISWTNSDTKPLYKEARQKAVANAIEKTKTYAQAAGLKTGRIISISETSGERPMPRMYARAQPSMVMASEAPVAQGEQDYSVSVTVTQELRKK